MRSGIRRSLLRWLIIPAIGINIFGAFFIYKLAWIPARNTFDQSLAEVAWALLPHVRDNGQGLFVDLPKKAEQLLKVDQYDDIYLVVRNQDGKTIFGDVDFPSFPTPLSLNKAEVSEQRMRNEAVRVVAIKSMLGKDYFSIAVAETLIKRLKAHSQILIALVIIEFLIIASSVLVIWLGVSRGLRPLVNIQANLEMRNHEELSPLSDESASLELLPVFHAINGLLEKVRNNGIAREEFLINIAHQIRTPLAGLKTQIDWLMQRHFKEEVTIHALELMSLSTERMTRQTNQLLTLAHTENVNHEQNQPRHIRLDKLVEESIQFFVEEADKKSIDIGFDLQATHILGEPFLLRDMIDNVIDNAIRYSYDAGKVTVRCHTQQSSVVFSVEDSGPGIPLEKQQLVFNRYYRINRTISGSGLGLSIVRDVAKMHDAQIVLNSGHGGEGMIFSIVFPCIPDANPA